MWFLQGCMRHLQENRMRWPLCVHSCSWKHTHTHCSSAVGHTDDSWRLNWSFDISAAHQAVPLQPLNTHTHTHTSCSHHFSLFKAVAVLMAVTRFGGSEAQTSELWRTQSYIHDSDYMLSAVWSWDTRFLFRAAYEVLNDTTLCHTGSRCVGSLYV